MQLKDVPAVFALGQTLFTAEALPTLYRSWDEYELLQLFVSAGEFCLVAEIEGEIVGFALGRVMEKPRSAWRYGWLLWLGIARQCKGKGIASRLIKELTDRFIENDTRIMLVDTDEANADALFFFRKHGFGHELKHTYLSRNMDDLPKNGERKNG